ncbi:GNAT family N-acetyltransferase [Kutzneria albida]|uniref:N-acetyltransferase domain-containing protein n=1 Tax=Kutzneria albida DSM 43870 TaxID=1449976 RepID=W5W964_9PSEU|nr:GNAT family N-acetyltransferase [Kutzneria albida]AHH97638.1 hypothetical protein KALB_4276 [Kutzneria albida DSM 43870]
MLIRHATAAELSSPPAFIVTDPVGFVDDDQLRVEAAENRMRPEWTWFAQDGDRIVGRAVWWGRSDSEQPIVLDCLHVLPDVPDRVGVAAALLDKGHAEFGVLPNYRLILRGGCAVDAVSWRSAAASASGLTDVIERLRFEWTPADGLPVGSGRLVFRPAEDAEFLAVFRRVAIGSLDVATQRDIESGGVDAQAQGDLEFYLSCPGERSWWRIAETSDGSLVGFAIPSATPHSRNVGYLGVLPELRGRGYVDDLLAEVTRVHAADGADRITATTDVPNKPMAAAFRRAGYQMTEQHTVFGPPRS